MITTMAQITDSYDGADRAQAEIIGAILLVVITLILASVLAVYVFDIGGQQLQDSSPQVNLAFQSSPDGNLTATHDGGQPVQAEYVDVVIDYSNATTVRENATASFGAGEIVVGDSAEVAQNVESGDIVRIVYIDPDTGDGTVLGRYVAR